MEKFLIRTVSMGLAFSAILHAQALNPIKVLMIGKQEPEKYHDPLARYNDFKGPMAQRGIQVDYTDDYSKVTDEGLKPYDAVLVYTMHYDWGKGPEIGAVKRFVEGGKGLVGVHTATAIWGSSEWTALIGALIDQHNYGNPVLLDILEPNHEALKGVPTSIPAFDETYFFVANQNASDREILQRRKDMPGAVADAWTWVRNQGKGRVYYTAAGHDEAWRTSEFQKQLEVALRWTSGSKMTTGLRLNANLLPGQEPVLSLDGTGRLSLSAPSAGDGLLEVFGMDARLLAARPVHAGLVGGAPLILDPGRYGYSLKLPGIQYRQAFTIRP